MSTISKNTGLTKLLPQFIKDLNRLQPEYASADRIWQLYVRTGGKPKDWAMLRVTHYQETYYVAWTLSDLALELDSQGRPRTPAGEKFAGKEARKLAYALKHLNRQVRRVTTDWARFYRQTVRHYPLTMRYGTLPKGILWEYYPDTYRVDIELGKEFTREFITHVRAYKFHQEYKGHHKKMTLALYMRYCEVAYLANTAQLKRAIEPGMSGLEMYQRFADGRHEGLTELPTSSAEAFAKWYRSSRGGGHPWEIYRGGNTTHIDLGVIERHERWSVYLRGSSTRRMAETIRIALALTKANLPVEIHDAEKLMLRLLGMDNIGIIPDYVSGHRAAQNFDDADEVFDCAHLRDLPRYNRILPFVTWKRLTPLRPLMLSLKSRPTIQSVASDTLSAPDSTHAVYPDAAAPACQ